MSSLRAIIAACVLGILGGVNLAWANDLVRYDFWRGDREMFQIALDKSWLRDQELPDLSHLRPLILVANGWLESPEARSLSGYPTTYFGERRNSGGLLMVTSLWPQPLPGRGSNDKMPLSAEAFMASLTKLAAQPGSVLNRRAEIIEVREDGGRGYWLLTKVDESPGKPAGEVALGFFELNQSAVAIVALAPANSPTKLNDLTATIQESLVSRDASTKPASNVIVRFFETYDAAGRIHRGQRHAYAADDEWILTHSPEGQLELIPARYRIPIVNTSLAFEFPVDGYVLELADERIPYYLLHSPTKSVTVSFNFPDQFRDKTAAEIEDALMRQQETASNDFVLAVARIGKAFVIERPPMNLGDALMGDMRANYAFTRSWVAVHLSKVFYAPDDRLLFADFLKSLHVNLVPSTNVPRITAMQAKEAGEWNDRAGALRARRNLAGALEAYTKSLELDPTSAIVLSNRGGLYELLGQYDNALADYREAVRVDPMAARPRNGLAWLSSAHPDIRFRDAKRAFEMATLACELTNGQNANYLDTLAAAYAEAGDFERALSTLDSAQQVAEPGEREEIDAHRRLFQERRPARIEVAP